MTKPFAAPNLTLEDVQRGLAMMCRSIYQCGATGQKDLARDMTKLLLPFALHSHCSHAAHELYTTLCKIESDNTIPELDFILNRILLGIASDGLEHCNLALRAINTFRNLKDLAEHPTQSTTH